MTEANNTQFLRNEIILRPNVILGTTHLSFDGKLTALLKCPFCNQLRNIHLEVIEHHIKYTHPGTSYQVSDFYHSVQRSSAYGRYVSKEELKLPWLRCIFCSYRDKIEWDLAQHIFEKHRRKLYQNSFLRQGYRENYTKKIQGDRFARFYSKIEYYLDIAVEIAKERVGVQSV